MGAKRYQRLMMLILLCVVLAGGWSPTRARTIYVDDDAAGAQDGSSWVAAFKYLQDAMAAASAGDEIRVAQGLYRPDQGDQVVEGDRTATFLLVDGVAILGGFAGLTEADPDLRDTVRFATILTGDLAGNDNSSEGTKFLDNSSHVVTATEASNGAVLDGLTITHGYDRDSGGNGLSNQGASLTLRDCTFLNNWTGALRSGGAIYNSAGPLRLENCRFLRNDGGDGAGALCNWGGSVQAVNCEFIENSAHDGAGAIENSDGNVDFFHCLFQGNHAHEGAGGITSVATLRLLYCTFIDNHVAEHAGALAVYGSAAATHCLFCRNRAEGAGAIYVASASVRLDQCTFYANVSTDEGVGAVSCPSSWSTLPTGSVQARGCVFWANGAWREQDEGGDKLMTGYREQIGGDRNAATLEYCCIQGWTPDRGGLGNIGTDPLFVAVDQNDFHLQSQAGHWDGAALAWIADDFTSPCIDAGDPNGPLGQEPFPSGGIVNMGVYGGTCEASKSWFGDEPGPGVEAADLNGDGRVDAEDYRLALQRWPQADQ